MGEDSGNKTEEPTPHKLREARKKGQIAKSKEFTSAILLFVAFYMLRAMAMRMWHQLTGLLRSNFELLSTDLSAYAYGQILKQGLTVFLFAVGPIFAAIFIVGVAVEALQTGFLVTMNPLEPKLENLDPIKGFKKFFSLKQYVELAKSLIKMALVIWVLYTVVRDQYFIVYQAQFRNLWLIMGVVGKMVITIITRVGIVYFLIALFDFFYQRYEFIKSMRMTKKEIKEEYKRLEGDPTIKQRQREAQRNLAQGRQMGAVPGADVVVTNPAHVAVALVYDTENEGRAPIVSAKGQRLVAEEIKKIADHHYVPIIENPPLARALFSQVKVGQEVPEDSFQIVAEILAFVYNLKKNRAR